jgi:DNA (cytosine-5)-methyltransferase 1
MNRQQNLRRVMTALDLFCGCGGTTQGLVDAGFRVLGGIENDELAAASYKLNHPSSKVWHRDIQKLRVTAVMHDLHLEAGQLDLLAGCPPCQSFSRLRRLNGGRIVRDKKSKDLIFEFLRFVRVLLPKTVMLENVPRLLSDPRFNEFFKELRKLGYEGDARLFNAADFGVPQRRRRAILIASRVGSFAFSASPPTNSRQTVRIAIGHLAQAGLSGDALHDFPEARSETVINRIAAIPIDGGSRRSLSNDLQLTCHKKSDGFKDVYGRMRWDDVAPTITSGCTNPSKGRFLHPTENRAITLREAAILQGFPADYRLSLERGKGAAALLIGNAFPPPFVKAHAQEIAIHLKRNRS